MGAGLVFSEDGVNAAEKDGAETEVEEFGGEHGSLKGAFCYNERVSIIIQFYYSLDLALIYDPGVI